ncbi:Ribokinase-like protein [Pisolithus croceorrhizus]|nr:Ribokinase-like protein [Pisolithus croceorrhizus]
MATPTYKLFCIGNPLLDLQVRDGEELYDDLVQNYQVTYVAGGASQNAARGAAYVLPLDSVVYTGCVGDDNLAEQLRAANKREGLHERYLVKKGEKTGACAVVITGHDRSLVTTLRAAEKFEKSHLSSPEVAPLVDAAKVFYVEGYFLTHGTETILEVSKKASASSKVFALNLSAPFIAQFFNVQLQSVLPYCDVIIGNETEAEAYASAMGLPEPKDLAATARAIALSPKANMSQPRIVIFTHGAESTVLVSSADPDNAKVYKVTPIPDDQIGGFLEPRLIAVDAGHKMGAMCVQLVGPQFKWPKVQIL